MMQELKEHGVFEITQQQLRDQERAIRKNEWLSDFGLKNTKRRNHTSSSMLLYQVIVGYVIKKSKRLKNIRI